MLSNLDIPFNFFIKNSVDSRWFFKNIARNKVSKVLLSRSYDNSTQKSVWNLIQSTKCKLKKKNLKTFINLFIFFLKQTRSTNKIHLWERLFKFDFLLFFFHQKQETKSDPFLSKLSVDQAWTSKRSIWKMKSYNFTMVVPPRTCKYTHTHTQIPRTANAGLNGAHAIFILHSIYCACLSIYT